MEEVMDFDEWYAQQKNKVVTYFAEFNPISGSLLGIYPSYACENILNKVEIDVDTAEAILEGRIKPSSCFIDVTSGTFEIIEVKTLNKIDDVLHRIIEAQWSDIEDPDVYVSYNQETKDLKFEMTERFSGTRKSPNNVKKQKVHWDGETEITFVISEYNDPNIFFEIISFKINDLVEKKKIVSNIDLPKKFSIYTRRIFKNYVYELE